MTRVIKIPDADHPITITPSSKHIVVSVGGKTIADTHAALILQEAAYPAVAYIPLKDVNRSMLQESTNATYCPYKGDCSYFSIPAGGERAVNAVWTYEQPYDAVKAIKDHVAFYPDRVDIVETP